MRAAPSVLSGGAFFFEGGHLLTLTPINLKTANAFVQQYHRHHKPTRGHKFSIGVSDNGALVGVAICGRPVARRLDDGYTLEVNRLCTNGTPNACSILYAAAYRAARAMGYNKVIVQQTIPKMQQLNEQQFKGLELEWYRPEDDAGK